MMFHFPCFDMPYNNRYSRYGYKYPYYSYENISPTINANSTYLSPNINSSVIHNRKNGNYKAINKNMNNCNKNNTTNNKNSSSTNHNIKNENVSTSSTDSPLFQLFGINLYFDDILLIFLIWFLYDEGVKDDELFIALILLLLS